MIIYHLQRKHKFHPRPDSPLYFPNEEPVLRYLKFNAKRTKREVFGMPIPGNLITADIQGESYYQEYLAKVYKHQRYLAGETGSDPNSPASKPTKTTKKSKPTAPKTALRPPITKPAPSQQTEPQPAPTQTQGKKHKLVIEISDKPSQARKSRPGLVSKRRKPISSLRSVDVSVAEGIPEKEPRVDDEEVDMQRALEESLKSIYDVPRGPLPLMVIREPESRKYQPLPEVHGKGKEKVTEEHVAHDLLTLQKPKKKSPADQYIFQRRTSTPTGSSSHDKSSSLYAELGMCWGLMWEFKVKARLDQTLMIKMKAMLDQTLMNKLKARLDQTLMSNLNLTVSKWMKGSLQRLTRSNGNQNNNNNHNNSSTTISTTTKHHRFRVMKRIDDLKHIMANLIQENKHLEERLDSHGAHLYTLENLDIPQRVSKAVDEIVTDAVDWAIQAPLRNRFRDLPEADMKEILHQRMWETTSYKTYEDHMMLYEALEKSMNRDHFEELAKDLAEARKKKRKRRDLPKTPLGSPPHQPPPPPPPAGPSGASGSPKASGSSQVPPPPPPPPSTNQEGQSQGSAAPSSLKTAASAGYQAWTTTDTRLWPSVSLTPADLQMDDDMTPDAQAQSSDDEDIGNAHIPKVNLRQDWWKPLEEERPATPEPAWSISSDDMPGNGYYTKG
nr:E-beta-farnesene synthase [Tanacetum cinerariifolium]